jgi:hypothetical protein
VTFLHCHSHLDVVLSNCVALTRLFFEKGEIEAEWRLAGQNRQPAFAKAKAGAANSRKSLISMIVLDNSTSPAER